jgi:hypothetical protein
MSMTGNMPFMIRRSTGRVLVARMRSSGFPVCANITKTGRTLFIDVLQLCSRAKVGVDDRKFSLSQ